ncbi:hypothetical protein V8C43DRAFT_286929 [Trichoderma afarasin]
MPESNGKKNYELNRIECRPAISARPSKKKKSNDPWMKTSMEKKNKREKKKLRWIYYHYSNAVGRSVPCLGPVDKSNGESCQWTRLKSRRHDKEQEKRKIFCLQRVSLACLLCKTATLRISALPLLFSSTGLGGCDEWLKKQAKEEKRKKRMSWQACKMSEALTRCIAVVQIFAFCSVSPPPLHPPCLKLAGEKAAAFLSCANKTITGGPWIYGM